MRKNKFFDTIMIALILMSCFKLLYPDAFTFDITVNTSSVDNSSDSDNSDIDNGNTSDNDKLDLPEYASIEECMTALFDGTQTPCSSLDGSGCSGAVLFANSDTVIIGDYNESLGNFTLVDSSPCFYINGELWYSFDVLAEAGDIVAGYKVLTDCEWICDSVII